MLDSACEYFTSVARIRATWRVTSLVKRRQASFLYEEIWKAENGWVFRKTNQRLGLISVKLALNGQRFTKV